MAGKRANLTVLLKLDNKRFVSGLRTARAAAGKFAAGVGRLGLRAARAAMLAFTAALAASAAAMVVGVKNALDFGGRMSDVAAQTKISVTQIQIWEEALRQGGIESEKFGDLVGKMQKSVFDFSKGLSTQKDAFAILGISLDEIFTLNASDQLDLISKKLQGIKNDSVRVGIARDLLGRSGAKLFAVFGDGGAMAKATQTLGEQVEIFDRQAATFDRISDVIGSIGVKMRGFFAGVADILAPMLLDIAERFDKIDLAATGQAFGEAISQAMDNIKDIPALIGEGLVLAAMEFINILRIGVAGIVAGITTGPLKFLAGPAITASKAAGTEGPLSRGLEKLASLDTGDAFEAINKMLDPTDFAGSVESGRLDLKNSIDNLFKDRGAKPPKDPAEYISEFNWLAAFDKILAPVEKKNPFFIDYNPADGRAFRDAAEPVEQEKFITPSGRVDLQRSFLPAGGSVRRGVAGRGARQGGLDALAALNRQSPGVKEQERSNVKLDTLIGRLDDFNRLAREAL